jgi:hypothetical protein
MKRAVANDKWVWTGLRRGLALRCPNCGEGRLLANYLKVRSPARSAMRPTPFTRPTTSRHTSRYSLPGMCWYRYSSGRTGHSSRH